MWEHVYILNKIKLKCPLILDYSLLQYLFVFRLKNFKFGA